MRTTSSYRQQLQHRLHDVFFVEPNDLEISWITHLYKITTGRLKKMPFFYILPLSMASALIGYLVLGHLLVRLVSVLQYGF